MTFVNNLQLTTIQNTFKEKDFLNLVLVCKEISPALAQSLGRKAEGDPPLKRFLGHKKVHFFMQLNKGHRGPFFQSIK